MLYQRKLTRRKSESLIVNLKRKAIEFLKKNLPLNVCHIFCIYLPDFEVAKNGIIHQFTPYRTQVMTTLLTLYHFSLFHQVEPAREH